MGNDFTMLTLAAVRDANLTPMADAVDAWKDAPDEFKDVAKAFDTQVRTPLWESDWSGDTADAAFKTFTTVTEELNRATEQARDTYKLLAAALKVFQTGQQDLVELISDVGDDPYLKLNASGQGEVGLVRTDALKGKDPEQQKAYIGLIDQYNQRLKSILHDVSQADADLQWALGNDENGRKRGFDADGPNTLKDAEQRRHQAYQDAQALTEITSLGYNATTPQLLRAHRLLAKHEGDLYFAELAAANMGAEGTLRFWQVGDRTVNSKKRQDTLTKLQESLGVTLATATHSNSKEMQRWKKDIIALGAHQFPSVDHDNPRRGHGPYGFQMMSSLMRHGDYDAQFLNDYGNKLIDFERNNAHGDAQKLWMPDSMQASLNFTGTDKGNDPMAGFLEAVSRNPEAAKSLFHSADWDGLQGKEPNQVEDDYDPELKYLLHERDWFLDPASAKGAATSNGADELGRALETATLGVPSGRPELGIRRDDTTANIMDQVTALTNSRDGLLKDVPQLRGSFAKMAAGYLDDLDWGIRPFGVSRNDTMRDSVYDHTGAGHFSPDNTQAVEFMYSLGESEEGHGTLSAAQRQYTLNVLKAHSDDVDKADLALVNGAKAHGILDQARADDIHATYEAESEAAQRKMAESSLWKKFSVGKGLGTAATVLSIPFGSPEVPALTRVAVPAAIDTIAGAASTEFGIELDRRMAEQSDDIKLKEKLTTKRFEKFGKDQASLTVDAYVDAYEAQHGHKPPYDKHLYERVANSYGVGKDEAGANDAG